MNLSVCHLSSVHAADDPRIRFRYCESLHQVGVAVTFVGAVPSEQPVESNYDVVLVEPRLRFSLIRRLERNIRAVRAARRTGADIVHFHDPELLLFAPLILRSKHRLVYDAHEDVVRQIDLKGHLPGLLRSSAKRLIQAIFDRMSRFVHGAVVVDPRFLDFFANVPTVLLRNRPLKNEFAELPERTTSRSTYGWGNEEQVMVYIGSISPGRNISVLFDVAMHLERPVRFVIAGRDSPPGFLREQLDQHPVNDRPNVQFDLHNQIDRDEVRTMLAAADVGLSVLPPTDTYTTALPTKLLEYASAALPMLASDFSVCADFIADHGAGVVANPLDPAAMAAAMDELWEHRTEFVEQAKASRTELPVDFFWESELQDVLALYRDLVES